MFSYLQGKLVTKEPFQIVVDVGGVGYIVNIPLSSYDKIGQVGGPTKVLTHLYVREDILQLFGFATEKERELFQMLITVSGVGPKMAQAILSGMSVDDFKMSVMRGDEEALTTIPGVGKKIAQRLMLELRDKLGKIEPPEALKLPSFLTPEVVDRIEESVLALVQLGVKQIVAKKAVDKVIQKEGPDLPIEEIIKKALQHAE